MGFFKRSVLFWHLTSGDYNRAKALNMQRVPTLRNVLPLREQSRLYTHNAEFHLAK